MARVSAVIWEGWGVAQRPSKWCKKYGPTVPVPARLPHKLWGIAQNAAKRKGISGNEFIIEALLMACTDEDLTGEPT